MAESAKNMDSCDLGAARVRASLQRWSERLETHCTEKRGAERSAFFQCILIYLPPTEGPQDEDLTNWTPIGATTRDISSSGLSFIYHEPIADDSIAIRIDDVLILLGTIVRRRQVHDGYWEFGVRFIKRHQNPGDPDDSPSS